MLQMFIDLLEAVSLSALGLVIFTCVRPLVGDHTEWERALFGLLFGLMAVISILGGFSPWTGVILDGRTVMVAIAGIFGGPTGGAIAALLASVCRVAIGGDPLPAVVAIVAVATTSVLIGASARRVSGAVTYPWLMLAAACATILRVGQLVTFQSGARAAPDVAEVAVLLGVAIVLGIMVIGTLMIREECRIELAKRLSEATARAEQARNEAESANRAKSEFLASMSHELRTPLNAVIGFAEIIEQEVYGKHHQAKYRECAALIGQSGHHLLRLINDVLDLSVIEAQQLTLTEAEFDLGKAISEAVRMISSRARRAGIELTVIKAGNEQFVHADELRLKQVVLNLLSNAIKFTPSGGRIAVTQAQDSTGQIVIAIEDTGVGISREDLAKLFVPFGRAEAARRRRTEGTGLGLMISRRLMEAHGGRLDLESEPGRGTRAILTLPAARSVPTRAAA